MDSEIHAMSSSDSGFPWSSYGSLPDSNSTVFDAPLPSMLRNVTFGTDSILACYREIENVRAFFLYLSRSAWLRRFMEQSSLSQKLTRRFVAGMTLDEEMEVCKKLYAEHVLSTLDHLGENVSTIEEASNSVEGYMASLDRIAELEAAAHRFH